MKKISSLQVDQITAVTAENFSAYPPAALEKDLHLTEIISYISKINNPNTLLTFGGGTSLVKGYKLFDRMSEDLDFKLNLPASDSKNSKRKALGDLRDQLHDLLISIDYEVKEVVSQNNNSYFAFELSYQSQFEVGVSLRDYIKLEFTESVIQDTPSVLKIETLLSTAIKEEETKTEFPCVSLSQTAAEKVLSFLIRFNPHPESRGDDYDERIVRHLHDLYFLTQDPNVELKTAQIFDEVLQEDIKRFSGLASELGSNPKKRLLEKLNETDRSHIMEREYGEFVLDLTLGHSPTIDEAKSAFLRMALLCLKD